MKSDFVVLLPARADAAVSSLSFGPFKHKEIQHCNTNLLLLPVVRAPSLVRSKREVGKE